MGAIKLIDLDQEIFVPIYDEAQDMTYEQIMTIGDMFDKFMGGYQPPIIDAIPVEWLKWRILHAEKEGFAEVAAMLRTVRDWWNDQRDLWLSEKEQEAR